MSAGNDLDGNAQPLGDQPALEVEWQEPIVMGLEEACNDVRPRCERPRLAEQRVEASGLFARRHGLGNDVRWNVVKERFDWIKCGGEFQMLASLVGGASCRMTGVLPPLAGGLS